MAMINAYHVIAMGLIYSRLKIIMDLLSANVNQYAIYHWGITFSPILTQMDNSKQCVEFAILLAILA